MERGKHIDRRNRVMPDNIAILLHVENGRINSQKQIENINVMSCKMAFLNADEITGVA